MEEEGEVVNLEVVDLDADDGDGGATAMPVEDRGEAEHASKRRKRGDGKFMKPQL